MQGDDPPYLSVGTAVSAKYKGAFCEAKVSKVVRIVKCKVTYKMGLGTATVNDDQIKGTLRVGQIVQAKHPEKKEYVDATIAKIQDCSQYTVVFDDGDITTLRRTALCLKSGRHFNESETLDQLPLTHPEHFGNPVMGGRRGRRSRQLKEDSSEGEAEEENEPDLELYSADAGKVVSVETSDKKKSKDNWFPGLIVMPSAQPTVRINVKDEFLIRSFKDGRYYTVPKKEISEFKREMGQRVESSVLSEAVNKAIKFLDQDELPVHWERSLLLNVQSQFSDSDENLSDTSDDEPTIEKDHFVAQLYKFMDDSGTPLNKTPTIAGKDVDLYRLFGLVHKLGGYNRVTNQSKWKTITTRLKFNQTQSTYNQVKQVYKKCLLSYESFYRTLGCTMLNHTRNPKKNRGRPLIRDKDRVVTPVQSPRPEKEDEVELKKEEEIKPKSKKVEKVVEKVEKEDKKRKDEIESSDNSSDATDQSENQSTSKEMGRPKRNVETKGKDKKKIVAGDKVKVLIEKYEEQTKKIEKESEDEKEKVQQTRSKSQAPRSKDVVTPEIKTRETKTPLRETPSKSTAKAASKKILEEEKDKDKKRGRKRNNDDKASEKASASDSSLNDLPSAIITTSDGGVSIGDKLKVYYGPTHESKVTYEAKVIEIDTDTNGQPALLVHYTGWNTRYDEWINLNRIAENLSATTKAKRLKQGGRGSNKPVARRGRGMSITGRSTIVDAPRSTTPSSVTSNSSRTKSPATTTVKTSSRTTRQGDVGRRTRRTSVQTDVSIPTESETDERSDSEAELSRTRSGARGEETEVKTYRKKLTKTKPEKRKEDEDTEKEEDTERPKRSKKLKKVAEIKSIEDTDDDDGSNSNQPKGREFDLNQIRSELKGFGKAIKLANSDTTDKDVGSSDESSSLQITKNFTGVETLENEEKVIEKSESSDDIYEFKEPEPFEFETRKIAEDKSKKRIPRLFEEAEKSPKKKGMKTPPKNDFEIEKKSPSKKTPVKTPDEEEEEKEKPKIEDIKSDDPFDKLVESPSFNTGKCSIINKLENNSVCKVLNMDEPLDMFEMPEPLEDSEDRLEISDSDDRQALVSFSHAPTLFLPSAFDKANVILETACDSFENKLEECKLKDSEDDDDSIRASIQRVIEQSSLIDDESNDTLLTDKPSYFDASKLNESKATTSSLFGKEEITEIKEEVNDCKEIIESLPKQIVSVFQESDTSLLKDLCAAPQIITKVEDTKDLNIKTGTKIADTILQKFSMINKNIEENTSKSEDFKSSDEEDNKIEEKVETKLDNVDMEEKFVNVFKEVIEPEIKVEEEKEVETDKVEVKIEEEVKLENVDINKPELDIKKRSPRKFVSKEYIDDTDSDSDSDSEQRLVIARSDEDSQTSISFDAKVDTKESDSNISNPSQIEDSQSQEEKSNFKFDNLVDNSQCEESILEEPTNNDDLEAAKEEEPDSHLHSMLLCEETIPGSPAPVTQNEPKVKNKNILEMPFASAPSSSNNKSCIQQEKMKERKENVPVAILPIDNRDARDVSTVLDNTPPTTPESTISNLSPRGDIGGLSPNIADNESCKSNEADNEYINQRRTSINKSSTYSEDDSLLNNESQSSIKKGRDELPSPCKKRRRSCKLENDIVIPAKRGRKPNRSQHNSDSDDTSEHSIPGMSTNLEATRMSRSPRPSKYNFFVEFDPSLDAPARIAVLQQRLQDLRKTYANVKAELVTIERRRKKIRRREREALKAAKQELACT